MISHLCFFSCDIKCQSLWLQTFNVLENILFFFVMCYHGANEKLFPYMRGGGLLCVVEVCDESFWRDF